MKIQYFDADHGDTSTCGWICYRNSSQCDRMMRAEFGDNFSVFYQPIYTVDATEHHLYDTCADQISQDGVARIEIVASTADDEEDEDEDDEESAVDMADDKMIVTATAIDNPKSAADGEIFGTILGVMIMSVIEADIGIDTTEDARGHIDAVIADSDCLESLNGLEFLARFRSDLVEV